MTGCWVWGGHSHQGTTLAPNLPQAHGPPPPQHLRSSWLQMTGVRFTSKCPKHCLTEGRLRAAFVIRLP